MEPVSGGDSESQSKAARNDQAIAAARSRIAARRVERLAMGWDERNSGQWAIVIGIGFTLAGVLCLIAAFGGKLPYSFFQLCRWAVFAVCAITSAGALRTYGRSRRTTRDWAVAATLCGVGLLFNPIAPIHLTRATWKPIDIVIGLAAVLLGPAMCAVGIGYLRQAARDEVR